MILILGAMSPLNGGTTVSLSELSEVLSSDKRFIFFDIALIKEKPVRRVVRLFYLFFRAKVISVHASDGAAIKFCPLLYIFSRALGKKFTCRQFGGEFQSTYSKLSSVGKWLVRKTYLHADYIYLQTKYLVDYFHPLSSQNSVVRLLPTSRLSRLNYCILRSFENKLQLIFLGRVVREKGLCELIKAVLRTENVCLKVYGPCNDESLLSLLKSSDNIEYNGEIGRHQIGEVLNDADVFVLPSYHEGEGYSGAVVEALFSGLPLIISRWNAFPEMLEDDEVFFVQPRSIDSLADCIQTVSADRNLLRTYSQKSFSASERFNLKLVSKQFIEDHLKCAGY